MMTPKALELLMERAKADGAQDPEFFKALLEATVYVHVPKDKRRFPWRFMQFRRPTHGMTLIPCFTDQARARRATHGVARVKALTGRAFLEATRGSTLILNPEDSPCCVLYPEEIASLLDEGYLAEVQTTEIDDEESFCALGAIPEGLAAILTQVLQDLPSVEVAYVAGWRPQDDPEAPVATLIILLGDPKLAERAARALTTVLQRQASRFGADLDLVHFDMKEPPTWIAGLGLQPIFRRSMTKVAGSAGNALRH